MDLNISLYSVMKLAHVLLVIVAVGANATYGVWFTRAAKESEHQEFTLKGVQVLDDKIANPAYLVILLLGVGMVLEAGIGFSRFWIAASLVLYVAVALIAATQFTPLLRKQIAAAEAGETDSDGFASANARGRVLGAVMGVLLLLIISMMVLKPTL